MPETNPQQRNRATHFSGEVNADSSLSRTAGARRQDDGFGLCLDNFGNGDLIIANDSGFTAQLGHVPSKVEDEAVVIVDQQNHAAVYFARGAHSPD